MRRSGWKKLALATLGMLGSMGAAPATPSYQPVIASIDRVRADWARPGAAVDPNAPGWNVLFDALTQDLKTYSSATTEHDRLVALNRIHQVSESLAAVDWPPAAEVRQGLRTWMQPRVRLAWAERRLVDTIQAMPPAPTDAVRGNRDKWRTFLDQDLGQTLRAYDRAGTVADRAKGIQEVHRALDALEARTQSYPWGPALELQSALDAIFSRPNFDVSADLSTVSHLFNVNLVNDGWVYRKGYWSWVTAGPKTGFGLMSSDDGIAFFNRQRLTSTTNIHDFQNQIASDQRGRRAAKMYQFGATSCDQQELTIVTVLRTTGLELQPSFAHAIGLSVGAAPQQGGGLQRAVAGLLGFGQARITEMVRENAFTELQPRMVQEAAEMGWEKTSAEAAQRNANMRQYLIGNDRLLVRDVLVEDLELRSRPENVLASGLLGVANAGDLLGADLPQPASLAVPDSGISADLHLGSLLSNLAAGFLKKPEAQSVQDLMVEVRETPPGTPPAEGIKTTRNADYAAFLKAIDEARATKNSKNTAIRLRRPSRAPEFGADAQGNLVVLIHDLHVELPAPASAPGGGAVPRAKVYRMVSPLAEVSLALTLEPASGDAPMRVKGRIAGFDPGPAAKMFAVQDDESKAQPMTTFTSALIFGLARARLQALTFDVPLNDLKLKGVTVRSVSPLDPSGWVRVVLDPTAEFSTLAAP